MKTGMYMDGRGILERTDKLNDALFDAVLPAILGSWVAFGVPFLSWAFLLHNLPWESPATQWHWFTAITVSVPSIIGGTLAMAPWFKALRAVTKHRKSMERETREHGRGWAQS